MWSKPGQRCRAKVGLNRQECVKVSQVLWNADRIRPSPPECEGKQPRRRSRASAGSNEQILQVRPGWQKSARGGRNQPISAQFGPMSNDVGRTSTDVGQGRPGDGRIWRAVAAELGPKSGKDSADSANLGPRGQRQERSPPPRPGQGAQQVPQWPWLCTRPMTPAHLGQRTRGSKTAGISCTAIRACGAGRGGGSGSSAPLRDVVPEQKPHDVLGGAGRCSPDSGPALQVFGEAGPMLPELGPTSDRPQVNPRWNPDQPRIDPKGTPTGDAKWIPNRLQTGPIPSPASTQQHKHRSAPSAARRDPDRVGKSNVGLLLKIRAAPRSIVEIRASSANFRAKFRHSDRAAATAQRLLGPRSPGAGQRSTNFDQVWGEFGQHGPRSTTLAPKWE